MSVERSGVCKVAARVPLIVNGTLVGVFFDQLGRWVGKERAYAFIPVWQLFFYLLMLFFVYKVFKSWKAQGGDEHYVAKVPDLSGVEPDSALQPCCPGVKD